MGANKMFLAVFLHLFLMANANANNPTVANTVKWTIDLTDGCAGSGAQVQSDAETLDSAIGETSSGAADGSGTACKDTWTALTSAVLQALQTEDTDNNAGGNAYVAGDIVVNTVTYTAARRFLEDDVRRLTTTSYHALVSYTLSAKRSDACGSTEANARATAFKTTVDALDATKWGTALTTTVAANNNLPGGTPVHVEDGTSAKDETCPAAAAEKSTTRFAGLSFGLLAAWLLA
jgi:hypothetical protein